MAYYKTLAKIPHGITRVKASGYAAKMNNLFWADENSIEQCFAAHIVQCCQQYFSVLLHLIAG